MTDRELLALAAKAAGLLVYFDEDGKWWNTPHCRWNPLTDSGQAFELAVTLGRSKTLTLHVGVGGAECLFDHPEVAGFDVGDDPCASARRAIVLAAAEIGRATP